jgi:RimJ/RimL family protein N-acetyltransferase
MDIQLSTRRLLLRPLALADAETMFRYRSRADVSRYQIWRPVAESEASAFIQKQIGLTLGARGTWFGLAITLRENGIMIGDIGLHFPENDSTQVEVGITLTPGYRHRGLAAEALSETCRFIFFDLNKNRVYASVDPRNKASIRLLERMGMRREAFMPGSMVIRGELVDDAVYGLKKPDFHPVDGRG